MLDPSTRRPGVVRGALVVLAALGLMQSAAVAGHMGDWRHDHSARGIPYRPKGLSELKRRFEEFVGLVRRPAVAGSLGKSPSQKQTKRWDPATMGKGRAKRH